MSLQPLSPLMDPDQLSLSDSAQLLLITLGTATRVCSLTRSFMRSVSDCAAGTIHGPPVQHAFLGSM